jgi:hypothetical protein
MRWTGHSLGRLRLDPDQVTATIVTLERRIEERFPSSKLGRLCGELRQLSAKAALRTAWIRRPLFSVRLGVFGLILAFGLLLWSGLRLVPVHVGGVDPSELLQGFEAALSSLVLLGAAVFFLATIERRVKRMRALRALHELRVVAHIVDMYQLSKDPIDPRLSPYDTRSSPKRDMTPYEVSRYLDYSSEVLALISKVAALYIHDFDDPVVLAGVDGLQRLLDGLSQKIWHKASIVDRIIATQDAPLVTSRAS